MWLLRSDGSFLPDADAGFDVEFPADSAVEAHLARIDPDGLSPREALEALYALKGLLAGGKPPTA